MGWRHGLAIVIAALLAASLGLLLSVALYGPGPLLRSALGQRLLQLGLVTQTPPGLHIHELGEPIATIRLPDLKGRMQRLPHPGRAVLINYWASWCGPCREEMPLLAAYARSVGTGNPEVVGIALDSREAAQAFLVAYPVPFTILVEEPLENDSSVRLGNREGILPFTVLIDGNGRLIRRQYGAFGSAEELRRWADSGQ